jgi:hypothetical protein
MTVLGGFGAITDRPIRVANADPHGVIALLTAARLPLDTEQALQDAIEGLLKDHGKPYLREFKVTGGRIDFAVGAASRMGARDPLVGIECKVKGGKRAIFKQCDDYCRDPRIGQLVVVTGMALALPAVMHGKPVAIIQCGRSWL